MGPESAGGSDGAFAGRLDSGTGRVCLSRGGLSERSLRVWFAQPARIDVGLVTPWCGVVSPDPDTSYRIRAHNLGCPAARGMASRYLATGNHPRGYSCAASALYCWTHAIGTGRSAPRPTRFSSSTQTESAGTCSTGIPSRSPGSRSRELVRRNLPPDVRPSRAALVV